MTLAEAFPTEVGDDDFGLEIDSDVHIQRSHKLVGTDVQVNALANEILRPFRHKLGVVTGVIMKHGQVAGYEVRIGGQRYVAPKKDFFTDRLFVEDVHLHSPRAAQIQELMAHWSVQRNYYGPAWDGIEYFHYQLAKCVNWLTVEAVGWYKYETSGRSDMDGKDWRLVIPDVRSNVVVNCHSLLHDGVWSLATTIFSTRDINPDATLGAIGGADHWARTLNWSISVAEKLQTHGYEYTGPIKDFRTRLARGHELREIARELRPVLAKAHQQVFGRPMEWPAFSIGCSSIPLHVGSVGVSVPPTDAVDYAIIAVHPKAFEDPAYLRHVVRHELCHTVMNQDEQTVPHDDQFRAFATAAGLPREYQD